MKIKSIWECSPTTKRFWVEVITDSGETVRPLVEIEFDGDGEPSIVDVEFLDNDDELSNKEKGNIEDLISQIDWQKSLQ